MSFTRGQQRWFRALVSQAWAEEAGRSGKTRDDKAAEDRWYRCELLAACGCRSSAQCNAVTDYDTVMLHFAGLAGDDRAIGHFSAAAERRALKWLRAEMRRAGKDWQYVRGILNHMHLPETLEDVPAPLVRKVCIALNAHNRRHAA